MSRNVRLFSLTLVLLLVISAVNFSTAQEDTLKIGVLTDHSGALSIYGFEQTQGFELGLEYATGGTMEVAGRKLEIVVRDNAGDVDTGVADARELIESEGVEILVGTVSSTVTLSLQASALEYDTILFAGPAATPAVTGEAFNVNTFRVCRNSFHDAFAAAQFGIGEYGTSYVQLAPDSAFGVGSAGAFDFALQALGATPVRETVLVAADTTDFTPAITEVLESGADFVVVTWAGASGATLFNQMGDLGVKDTMGMLTAFNSNDIQQLLQTNSNGDRGFIIYHYTLPETEANDWLVENHQAKFASEPDLFTECGFATAQALVAALEATEGDTLPEAMIPALEGLSFEGPKGTYTIRPEDHQALVPMYIVEMVDSESATFEYYELLQTISAEDTAPPCLAPGRSSETLTCPPAAE
jgi:branched-chain amino acid transport system substrate-binding protein